MSCIGKLNELTLASNHGLMSLVHIVSCLLTSFVYSRQYKSDVFRLKLLDCLRALQVPVWSTARIGSEDIKVHKVSGSLTNAVFFVSCHSPLRGARTLLLRIYGPCSGSLISRPRELHTLHVLSSQYHIGPRVYGTFENGRVEEYFESTTLTPSDIRDPTISRWIGARMAELHSVDIDVVEGSSSPASRKAKEWDIGALNNVKAWLGLAEDVLKLPVISDTIRTQLDLKSFKQEWGKYLQWLLTADDVNNGSRRVFAHNDAQYGNLLRLQHSPTKIGDEHRQVGVHGHDSNSLHLTVPRRSLSSISSTLVPIQRRTILQTIFMNGLLIITLLRHICMTLLVIPRMTNAAISTLRTWAILGKVPSWLNRTVNFN